ncbi:MAG TPA: hypothetical protein VFP55_00530 [Solirubrobacteraceae bacterium]|nr:hypothetical protein [Solirubrobacteraceae bacterium]
MTTTGGLVSVAGRGPALDGIVFDVPSSSKVVVAVVDPKRGPLFRTVDPKTLTARDREGPHDRALHQLIRRTPSPTHGAARGDTGSREGRSGFKRGATHRTTGK